MGRVLIGTSGFSYPHWGKGVFYPPHLNPQDWLAYYSHYFDTVEINSSFYRLPTEETLNRWRDITPADFTLLYDSCYSPESLQVDAERILSCINAGFDVYIYFNNDACGYALQNGLQLKQLIKEYSKDSDLSGAYQS